MHCVVRSNDGHQDRNPLYSHLGPSGAIDVCHVTHAATLLFLVFCSYYDIAGVNRAWSFFHIVVTLYVAVHARKSPCAGQMYL